MSGMLQQWWWLPFLGLAMGMLGGTFGVGGGIIMVPALVLIYGLGQQSAQGLSLTVMVPLAMAAAATYYTSHHKVDLRVAGLLAVGAVVGAYLGAKLAQRIEGDTLRKAFAVFMMLVSIQMFFKSSKAKAAPGTTTGARPPTTAPASDSKPAP